MYDRQDQERLSKWYQENINQKQEYRQTEVSHFNILYIFKTVTNIILLILLQLMKSLYFILL